MSWLRNLLPSASTPAPPAPQPALGRDAAPPRTFSPAIEHHARASGFRNAEQMLLWQKQRAQHSGGTVSGGHAPSIHDAFAWHPANTIQYATDAMKAATDN